MSQCVTSKAGILGLLFVIFFSIYVFIYVMSSVTYQMVNTIAYGNTSSSTDVKNASQGERFLIYKCERGLCKGWADRQRGIVQVFLLALVTHRRFGVIMTTPCDITKYYVPNVVNWTIPGALLRNKQSVLIHEMNRKQPLENKLKTVDFNVEYPQEVVYIQSNTFLYWDSLKVNPRYKDLLPNWANAGRAEMFRTAWNLLMKPSEDLQRSLDMYLKAALGEQGQEGELEGRKGGGGEESEELGRTVTKRQNLGGKQANTNEKARTPPKKGHLVCCHIRLGKSETIPTDPIFLNSSELPTLWTFLRDYVNHGSRLFIATDSYKVRNISRELFRENVTSTDGPILHVQKGRTACEGFGAAMLDQIILSKCDVLVKTHSGFSRLAAYLRNRDDDLFYFAHGKVTNMTMDKIAIYFENH